MEKQIGGGIAILFWVAVFAFVTSPIGIAVLGILAALVVLGSIVIAYHAYEPWQTFTVPRWKTGKQVLARGRIDAGQFILTRERVIGSGGEYPFILTRSLFNRSGTLVSVIACVVTNAQEDGRIIVGTYRGQLVILPFDAATGSPFIDFNRPDNIHTWQVFPPLSGQELKPRLRRQG